MNGDIKGRKTDTAPEEGVDVIATLEDGTITIARSSSGWTDRKGNKLENVLCCYPLPPLK